MKTKAFQFIKLLKNLFMVFSLTLTLLTENIFAQNSDFKYDHTFSKKTLGPSEQTIGSKKPTRILSLGEDVTDLIVPRLLFTPPQKTQSADEQLDCSPKTFTFSPSVNRNLMMLGAPLQKTSCLSVDEFNKTKQLNEGLCLGMAGCFKNSSSKELSHINIERINKARSQAATEAVGLTAASSISEMLDFEALKTFVGAKYGHDKLPPNCANIPVFKIDNYTGVNNGKCRTKEVDEGLKMAMQNCKMPNRHCYPEFSDYIKDKKAEPGKSISSDYFQHLAVKQSMDIIMNSNQTLEVLASIYASQDKSEEQKFDESFAYLKKNYYALDPIFKNYYNKYLDSEATGKENLIKAGVISWLKQNKNKSADEFKISLEKNRKEESDEILKQKCETSITMEGLCQMVDDSMAGTSNPVNRGDLTKLLSSEGNMDPNSPDYMQRLANNVARCGTFSLRNSNKGLEFVSEELANKWDLFASFDSSFVGFSPKRNSKAKGSNGVVIRMGADGVLRRLAVTVPELIASGGRALDEQGNERNSDGFKLKKSSFFGGIRRGESLDLDSSARYDIDHNSNQLKKVQVDDSKVIRPDVDTKVVKGPGITDSSFIDSRVIAQDKIKSIPVIDKMDSFNSIQNTNQEIRESEKSRNENAALINRVAELESRLKQMNASESETTKKKSGDSANSVVKKEQEDSSFNKEVASLQAELDDLKKAQAKKVKANESVASAISEVQDSSQNRTRTSSTNLQSDSGSDSAGASSRAPASISSASSSSSSDNYRSDRSTSSSGSSSKESSSPAASSTGSSIDSSGGKIESIVLAKVDSVNGAPASRESINNMIFSELGKPFYIEEEGLVKYIVPEVVDGKIIVDAKGQPVFKKIVKGKIGEFKIADKDDKKKKATSPADVKKMDEHNRGPVIRYKEFKDVIKASGATKAVVP